MFTKEFEEENKLTPRDFTRKRKLTFTSVCMLVLNACRSTMLCKLMRFVEWLDNSEVSTISKSAFSQARKKLKPEAFIRLNDSLVQDFYDESQNEFRTFANHRVFGIDGSSIKLPNSPELAQHFGKSQGNGRSSEVGPMGKASVCFDLFNRIIVDVQLDKYRISEHELAIRHLRHCRKGDIIVFDRGYPAQWLFGYLQDQGLYFVARMPQNFYAKKYMEAAGSDSGNAYWSIEKYKKTALAERLDLPFSALDVRVVALDKTRDKPLIVVTNLPDEPGFGKKSLMELYERRWRVEENYKHIKSNMELENFTGKSVESVYQDFYACAMMSNIQTMIELDTEEEIAKKTKGRKYEYKGNRLTSLGFLKDKIWDYMIDPTDEAYDYMVKLFSMEPVPIRNGRSFPRHKIKNKNFMPRKRVV